MDDRELLVAEPELEEEIKQPSLYHIVLLNDDYTPMDFVVDVIMKFFNQNEETATMLMFDVHEKGKAVVGTYTRDVAETKALQVIQYAQSNEHPLNATVEEA